MMDRDQKKELLVEAWSLATLANGEGHLRYGENVRRLFSKRQEVVLRLCHHDHFGLSLADAADTLNTTVQSVCDTLSRVRAVAPQLFPILTPQQAEIYEMFVSRNMPCRDIAYMLDMGVRNVQKILKSMYDDRKVTGLMFRPGTAVRLSYENWMDKYILTKF